MSRKFEEIPEIKELLDTFDARQAAQLKVARKFSRSQMRSQTMLLARKQGDKCPLSGDTLDFSVGGQKSNVVLDHDHRSGLVRAALTRGANGCEGKVTTAVATWGKVGASDNVAIVKYLLNLCEYLLQTPYPMIYPDHKTDAEKAAAKKVKVNRAAALKRAKASMVTRGLK